jgi:glutathione S-transferase
MDAGTRDFATPEAAEASLRQPSVADYPGGIDRRGHKQTADWYVVMKSRPSFRPLLGERTEVTMPPAHYDKPDF